MRRLKTTFMTAYRSRLYPNYWDMLALFIVLAVISLFAWNAKQMATPYHVGQILPISLKPSYLPFYAARTVVRMLLALLASLLFTFIFGTWAAKSKRAGRIIIPVIDILQSVPILGFLSVSAPLFISLFPGSMLGPECVTIFVIFTSQAWNMVLGFYQTVRTVPQEIQEAGRMYHLSAWQRFWRIDVPYSMPGLLWNTMASMSAGWFFVVASEAITVSNQQILLPGIGSYIAVAIKAANINAICYAIVTMFIVIVVYDQLLFRPLVAWADKFKSDKEGLDPSQESESWVIDLFRRTRLLRNLGKRLSHLFDMFVNIKWVGPRAYPVEIYQRKRQRKNWYAIGADIITFIIGAYAFTYLVSYIIHNFSTTLILQTFLLGLVTAFRVFILILICSLIWVPVGIWIGLRPKVAQYAQPVAQILAAFPANLFYPLIVLLIVNYQLSPNIWLTPLMILGAQWYILFNVIAGASTLPKDLQQVADNLCVSGWLRWKRLLLPGIFPYYVTGAITAAGGAWNASIVSEVASWGQHTLVATGLGAYITESTTKGSFNHTALGIGMMCLLVLVINRLLWRPLYVYAENRFSLE